MLNPIHNQKLQQWERIRTGSCFCLHHVDGWVCVCASHTWDKPGTRMHYVKEGKLAEVAWCFGQYPTGKPWVLPSMWMLLRHVPPTSAGTGTHFVPQSRNGSRMLEEHNKFQALTCPPNSPNLNPIEHLWDLLDKQVRSMEAPPCNLPVSC